MFGFVLKFSYRLCFRLINLFRMLSRICILSCILQYISCTFLESAFPTIYIYIYFKKLEITRSNKLLAIYRLNSGRDNDLGQVKLETCYIHVLSRYLSCEFLTTQTCLLKYKLARTGNILKNWKRKYIYIFYHQFQIYLNQTFFSNSLSILFITFGQISIIFHNCIVQSLKKLIYIYFNYTKYSFHRYLIYY